MSATVGGWILQSAPLDGIVESIADGRLEGHKQDAIYVRVGKVGDVVSRPLQIGQAMAKVEVERSERIGLQLRPYGRTPGLPEDLDSEKLVALFGLLTGRVSLEDYSAYWWAR